MIGGGSSRRGLFRAVGIAAAVGGMLGGTYAVAAAPDAEAATGDPDSSITVEWGTGDVTVGADATVTAKDVQEAQPAHASLKDSSGEDAGSGHWDDFKNLSVTVDKTTGLGNELISVTVAGFAGGTDYTLGGHAVGNYVQAMQCWGPDPRAADFWQTCQFGSLTDSLLVQNVIGTYSKTRGGADVRDAVTGASFTPYPFRAVTGQVSMSTKNVQPGDSKAVVYSQGLEPFFTSTSSNELVFQPSDADGTAAFGFATQSAATQPYLGCGDAAGPRCWLVIVPRGTHSGTRAGTLDGAETCDTDSGHTYGQQTNRQEGSPVAPDCTFFDDRVVIPLDFDETRGACSVGSAERRAVGTEFIADAYSSWQQALCAETGAAFSLNTNSGDLARGQLLTGQAQLAIIARRLAEGTIGSTAPGLLADADVLYAPLANTGLVFGFTFTSPTRVYTELRLTPRLIAKLLTQSYEDDIPFVAQNPVDSQSQSRDLLENPVAIAADPEWVALGNPDMVQPAPQIVVVGPQGDDAIALLWRYLRSDADARAFLKGEPDPWGARVNPYYLPPGTPGALDGGFDLFSASLDNFPKADRTTVPSDEVAKRNYLGLTIDSTSFGPYSGSFEANGSRIVRVDAGRANQFDPQRLNPWSAGSPPLANGQRYLMGPVTAADAADYGLATASISPPLTTMTTADTVASARTFVSPTDTSLTAAVTSEGYDAVGGADTDLAALASDAYPLTISLYAAANRTSAALDDAARADYADLLTFAAGPGQVRGEGPGQLPKGYVPLTEAQRAATASAATLVLTRPPQQAVSAPAPAGTAAAGAVEAPAAATGAPVATSTTATLTAASDAELTGGVTGSVALGGGLVAGLAGLAVAPFLLRRREAGG